VKNALPLTLAAVLATIALVAGQGTQAANESLWEASRQGDTARITAALAQGADVNAKARYDVTPLIAKNDMKEVIMATPAISDGVIVVRTLGHLYGIGQ
jgi:hypothetical protein